GGGHGVPAALADVADYPGFGRVRWVFGDEDVLEEQFGEAGQSVELVDRSHGHAVGPEVEHEVGQALVTRLVRVGAEQSEALVGERGAGGPHLLAVEDPAALDARGGRAQ